LIFEVVIPNLGATGGDVIIEEWLVKPGQFVQAGAPLFVVTTDKATVEVEAFRSGYLHSILIEIGSSLPPGSPVALLADTQQELNEPPPASVLPANSPSLESLPIDSENKQVEEIQPASRILASPLARRMARQAELDLAALSGSGRQGAILKRDVQRALDLRQPTELSPSIPGIEIQRIPVSNARKAIAQRTQWSKSHTPHFYATVEIDMGAARDMLSQAATLAAKHGWNAPTINDLVLQATAKSLRKVPRLNASYSGDEILVYGEINLGLVIGLADGMIVPVLHNVDLKNIFTIAAQTKKLKEKAQMGILTAKDLDGGTFTVSNLGMYGLDSFLGVINPPQAALLTLGAVSQKAVVREDQVVPRWMLTVSLSVDHRAVDGTHAAEFMQELRNLLENPFTLVFEAPKEEVD
jgi:pyruvate dehydrogenase E2 component (dihydrolipoamide acetyltransferase)